MDRILAFLAANPVFYFATVDGVKPRVRPFGFVMKYEGKIYFGGGSHKEVIRQLRANPNVEVCVADGEGRWMRLSGLVRFDGRETALAAAFEHMPQLRNLYTKENGRVMSLVYLEHGVATFDDMKGGHETATF